MFEHSALGASRVISGKGPLHLETLPGARRVFEAAIGTGTPRLIFDMEQVLLIDSAGLEMLFDLQSQCLGKGGGLLLVRPNGLCRDILRVTGIGPRFDIFEDLSAAAGSYAG